MNHRERLEKALESVCEYLIDSYSTGYDESNVYSKIYFKDGKAKCACEMTLQDWKEYLLNWVE